MAIYFDEVTTEKYCPVRGVTTGDDKDQVSFSIDSLADVPNLPGLDKIRGGSSAFDLSTKQVLFLTENGWV